MLIPGTKYKRSVALPSSRRAIRRSRFRLSRSVYFTANKGVDPPSTFLRNQDDSTMDLTELAVTMGSLLFPDQYRVAKESKVP